MSTIHVNRTAHREPLFSSGNVLPLSKVYMYDSRLLLYKYHHELLPNILENNMMLMLVIVMYIMAIMSSSSSSTSLKHTSAAPVLAWLSRNNPVLAPEVLTQDMSNTGVCILSKWP